MLELKPGAIRCVSLRVLEIIVYKSGCIFKYRLTLPDCNCFSVNTAKYIIKYMYLLF